MRFQSKYDNLVVTVRPKVSAYNIKGERAGILDRGLRAEFTGRLHVFDSEVMQKRLRWSDEERIEVEKFLIDRPEFNSDYTFSFDQQSPEYLEEWMEATGITLNENFARRCGKVWAEDEDTIVQCKNKAVPGKDFCADHTPSGVVSGMGTTVSGAK